MGVKYCFLITKPALSLELEERPGEGHLPLNLPSLPEDVSSEIKLNKTSEEGSREMNSVPFWTKEKVPNTHSRQ